MEREKDPKSKDYHIGLYHYFRFNETDLRIRQNLELCAQEFIPEEGIPLALRRIARDSLKRILILPASAVLDPSEYDKERYHDSVIYTPIDNF